MVAAIPHRDFSGNRIKKKGEEEEWKEDKREKRKRIHNVCARARAPSASLPEEG